MTERALELYWETSCSHQFLDHGSEECNNFPQDTRTGLLDCKPEAFLKPFPPIMHNVARLLFNIAQHVRLSYAAMAVPPPLDDHLHEAIQRFIVEYLVRHSGDLIWLTPGQLRIGEAPEATIDESTVGSSAGTSVGSGIVGEAGDLSSAVGNTPGKPTAGKSVDHAVPVLSLLDGSWEYPYFDPTTYELTEEWG